MKKQTKKDKIDPMDASLKKIMDGLTPQFVYLKSKEYHKEFEEFKAKHIENNKTEDDSDDESTDTIDDNILFRSFISHKVAALHIVLDHIVKHLNTT